MLTDYRIVLRPLLIQDAADVARLAGDEAVSKWTSSIPYPYSKQKAVAWISQLDSDRSKFRFAIEVEGRLAGCVSFWPYRKEGVEVGYWVGREFWGKGVCTQALRLLFASETFPAHLDVYAKVMVDNEASIRVLEKTGFEYLKAGTVAKGGRDIPAKFYIRHSKDRNGSQAKMDSVPDKSH